jgi:DNA-binding response OmpR family regulator/class 3 adenylate cyclase/predicted ATPase
MRSRIMVVGRDVALRARLARLLSGSGYGVEIAESVRHARSVGFEGIALAIVAPDGLGPEGRDLLQELRAAVGSVLLAGSSGSGSEPRSDSLDVSDEAGLLSRVAKALAPESDAPKSGAAQPVLTFAGYSLDLSGHSLLDRAGREVLLTHREFSLLRVLVQRHGRVLSRDQLLQALAGRDAETYDRSIDMQIVRLRRKIEPDPKNPSLIVTIPGSGYKFAAKVRQAEAIAPGPEAPAASPEPAPATPAAPERRYITALAAELLPADGVGLAADPEDLRALIDAYHRYVATVVARHGGVMAESRMREVLAYFGYPVAQEHAAERAIHAGLALAEHLAEGDAALPAGLAVRVGVASGLVVADPASGVLGETPGEAARLQDHAEPGQVVVAASTQRLAGRLFGYRDLGPVAVKGLAGPVQAWQVLGPSTLGSRSEALHAAAMTPLVGREDELDLLLRAWRQARRGEGRLVLLSGEAGIGKSRLLAALEEELTTENHRILRYFCSPLHQDSALYPIIARWEQEAGFARGESAETRLCKLESVLAPANLSPEDVALIAAILAVPTGERYPRLELSPQRRKERTFTALHRLLIARTRTEPVLMLFEDAHWADPSSLELLDGLVERLAELPILLVISYRSEFAAPWTGRADTSLISMSRLNRRQSAALAAQVTADRVLTPALLERIIAQTDGVPLFIEELTTAVLEASVAPNATALSLAVPATLQASLMARLDRLPAAKQVAQIGAVIGREFPHALLAALPGLTQAQLAQGLDELVGHGIVSRRGVPPDAVYSFKHALVRDATYEGLLRDRRRKLHLRVARALTELDQIRVEQQPELLALHLSEGGAVEEAAGFWMAAARRSLSRSALTEATRLLRCGLAGLAAAGQSPGAASLRLQLSGLLGPALITLKGPGADETLDFYNDAVALCRETVEEPAHFPIYWGWWRVARDFQTSLDRAAFLREKAATRRDPECMLQAHHCSWADHYNVGEFVRCREHIHAGLEIYRGGDYRHHAQLFGNHDPKVCGHGELSLVNWMQGRPDSALREEESALAWAISLDHVGSRVHAMDLALTHRVMRRDHAEVLRRSRVLIDFASEHGISDHRAKGLIFQGWTRGVTEAPQEGLATLREGFAIQQDIGSSEDFPIYVCLLAEALIAAGKPELAIEELRTAVNRFDNIGLRIWRPEVLRVTAEATLAADCGAADAARVMLGDAALIAEAQEATMLGLRTAVSRTRLALANGDWISARAILVPAVGAIEEPDGSEDVAVALAVLQEITPRDGRSAGTCADVPRRPSRS